jgi:hypothetical protein
MAIRFVRRTLLLEADLFDSIRAERTSGITFINFDYWKDYID